MIWELINPSDPYTFEADDEAVAAFVCLILGRGAYGLDGETEETENFVPLFILGGNPIEWFEERYDVAFSDMLKDLRVADALDSMLVCGRRDRQSFKDAIKYIDDPEKIKAYRDEFHDKRRGSLNDIGGHAYDLAAKFRAIIEKAKGANDDD